MEARISKLIEAVNDVLRNHKKELTSDDYNFILGCLIQIKNKLTEIQSR